MYYGVRSLKYVKPINGLSTWQTTYYGMVAKFYIAWAT